jgi:hypothetical protein
MTRGLERWYGGHDLHFITCSCYQRRSELDRPDRRDLFLRVLERARQKYRFVVLGYEKILCSFATLFGRREQSRAVCDGRG